MPNRFKYILLTLAGWMLILYCNTLQLQPQAVHPPSGDDYRYSQFLHSNYTGFTAILFFLTGLLIGYYFRLNPWLSGVFLVLIFPLAVVFEVSIDVTSHNLLPFELIIHFVYALPAIAGAYLGRFLFGRMKKIKS